MTTLLTGSILLSIFHGLIPSHWLPVIAVGRHEQWPTSKVLWVTFIAGLAHVLSTILLGAVLAQAGRTLSVGVEWFSGFAAPVLLILLGLVYVYRHYYHHHFHLTPGFTQFGLIGSMALAMFFSPCLEIEGYFLAAGQYGWPFVALMALSYALITIGGMLLWVRMALGGLQRLNWHAWEHYAGLITGITLIFSGVLLYLLD